MAQIQDQLESIPGYDFAMDKYNEYAEKHFNNTNPFEDKDGNKRKLSSATYTEAERRAWSRVQKLAWNHDKCFLGLCGVGLDCGVGLVPLAVLLLPVIGPIAMYVVHARLITVAQEDFHIPGSLEAKMQGNILLDLLISLPPVIGGFLSWLNGCLTRNAGMLYCYLEFLGTQRQQGRAPTYEGTRGQQTSQPLYANTPREQNYQGRLKQLSKKKKREESIEVGAQQSGIR